MKTSHLIKYIAGAAVIFFLLGLWYIKKDTVTVSDSRLTLGTIVEITLIGKDKQVLNDALTAAFARITEIEKITDRFTAGSEISAINRRKSPDAIPVSPDMLRMLTISRNVSDITGGAFDVTVAPLVDLWGFDVGGRLPKPEEIERTRALVDYHRVKIDENSATISLTDSSTRLDLGGIAQGYAAGEIEKILRDRGITGGVVNISGDIIVIGDKMGKPWRIGVQDPRNTNKLYAVINAKDIAIVTSGDYERCFFVDGLRYHHILDPKTGYPARGCASVTVVTRDVELADALSTAIFILGPEEGVKLVDSLKGVEVLITTEDGKRISTPGLSEIVEFVD
ncbi:MAG: FAD:protein FMN transferase [Deltaproteobacteria bacterium]|nr:FAD:protein FMN transferase [Candidatus Zymogenaceae bacterium]